MSVDEQLGELSERVEDVVPAWFLEAWRDGRVKFDLCVCAFILVLGVYGGSPFVGVAGAIVGFFIYQAMNRKHIAEQRLEEWKEQPEGALDVYDDPPKDS